MGQCERVEQRTKKWLRGCVCVKLAKGFPYRKNRERGGGALAKYHIFKIKKN